MLSMTDVSFSPAKPVRASEQVVAQIEGFIMSGTLEPGQHLPSERALMEQFEVSRSTVREALRVLESNGYIKIRGGDRRGPEVLPFSTSALNTQLTRMIHLDGVSFDELAQFRVMTETYSCQLAALNRTDEQLAEMTAAVEAMRAAVDKGAASFGAADVEYHRLIAKASGNRFIEVCLGVVRREIFEMMRSRIEEDEDAAARMLQSVEHDEELLAAIAKHDSREAGAVIRRFLLEYYSEVDGLRPLGEFV